MRQACGFILGVLCTCHGVAWAAGVLEYPVAMPDIYDADESCWFGMGPDGQWVVPVIPERWLVGDPPSELSAVTLPEDHWVDLVYAGPIVDSDGNDVLLVESGKVGEQAIVFLTDGIDREFPVGVATAEEEGGQELSYIGIDLAGVPIPFTPRGLRIVSVDLGGGSPGFDLGSVRARVDRSCESRADNPNPVSGAIDVAADEVLVWTPACDAVHQWVYFSAVPSQVEAGAPDVRYAVDYSAPNHFEPPELQMGRTYYWRVDHGGNPVEAHSSEVWSFTVADQVILDDFEAYDTSAHFLYETWHSRSNGSVSLVQGQEFRSCQNAMAFRYYFDNRNYSETYREYDPPANWARTGAQTIELWLRGALDNATNGQMYVVLSDGTNEQVVPYAGEMSLLTEARWQPWRMALDDFNEIDLTHVESVGIGLWLPDPEPAEFGRGTITIDDISLRPSICPDDLRPTADLNSDCAVDCRDLEQMARDWLESRSRMYVVAEPNEPLLWYTFDGNANDSAGSAHGQVEGRPTYDEGRYGRAIHFKSRGDSVVVPNAASVFAGIREAVTIAFWQKGDDSAHLNDTVCCSNYTYNQTNPSMAINLGCWRNPGQYRWDCGTPWSFDNRLAGSHRVKDEWAGRWNHWVFTKDTRVGLGERRGRMEIYLNGALHDQRFGADAVIEGITSFEIGSGWYGRYDGLIDDFEIYDYALDAAEVAWLATDGTGLFKDGLDWPADLDDSGRVALGDFAILAEQWLDQPLWP